MRFKKSSIKASISVDFCEIAEKLTNIVARRFEWNTFVDLHNNVVKQTAVQRFGQSIP